MILDLNGNAITTVHKVCVANYAKDKFLSVSTSGLHWTDNFNLASCFDDIQEANEFTEKTYVQEFVGDELELLIWTDTRKSVFEEN